MDSRIAIAIYFICTTSYGVAYIDINPEMNATTPNISKATATAKSEVLCFPSWISSYLAFIASLDHLMEYPISM